MGYYCCVPLCNSNSKRKNGISFHGFTKDRQLRIKWLQNIRRDVNSKLNPFRINHHTKICSLHFLKSDFKIASEKWRLKPNAIPSIFAWTNKKPKKNVIKVPSFIPKPVSLTENEPEDQPEEMIIKIENTESIAENKLFNNEPPTKSTPDDNLNNDDYKQMYISLLKENCYLKNELETLNYKYKDQEELYENLVVVNKTTQKENSELRHTVAILQACLKKTTIFHEPSTIYLTQNVTNNDKLIIQQQQFQQQYQQLLHQQQQLQLIQNRQLQQNYQIVQTKEKNFVELQKTVVNQYLNRVNDTQKKKKCEYGEENMLQKLLEKNDGNKKRKVSTEVSPHGMNQDEEVFKKKKDETGKGVDIPENGKGVKGGGAEESDQKGVEKIKGRNLKKIKEVIDKTGIEEVMDRRGVGEDMDKRGAGEDMDKRGAGEDMDKRRLGKVMEKRGGGEAEGKTLVEEVGNNKGVKGEGRNKGVEEEGDDKGVKGERHNKGVEEEGDNKGVEGKGDDKGVKGKGDDKRVKGKGDDEGVKGEGRNNAVEEEGEDKGVKGEGHNKGIEEEGEDKGVKGEGHNKGVEEEGDNKGVEGKGDDKGVKGKGDDKEVEGKGDDKGVKGKGDHKGVKGKGDDKEVEGEGHNKGVKGKEDDKGVEGVGDYKKVEGEGDDKGLGKVGGKNKETKIGEVIDKNYVEETEERKVE